MNEVRNTRRRLAVLICMKPVGNVPRLRALSPHLAARGLRVLVVGRYGPEVRRIERLGPRQWILNIDLHSRSISSALIRKPLVLFEFLLAARRLLKRTKPELLISFYNTCAILHSLRLGFRPRKVAWLLDFRHPRFLSLQHGFLEWLGARCWRHADAIVVPTPERLALHLALRPECIGMPAFVVHNSPNLASTQAPSSDRRPTGIDGSSWRAGSLRIVYCGGIGFGYGLEALIRVVGSTRDGVSLLMIGKRWLRGDRRVSSWVLRAQEHIERLMRDAPFSDNIRWVDSIPYSALRGALRLADVGYVTYKGIRNLNDRFSAPGKAYEYLAAGLALLTDDSMSIAPLLRSADCAALFPAPVTESGLRNAIRALVDRRAEIQSVKARAQRLFSDRLALDRQVQPLLSFLELGQCETVQADSMADVRMLATAQHRNVICDP